VGVAVPRGELRGLRVLIVDDKATNCAILHQQVIAWCMRNGTAADGARALALLHAAAAQGDPYDFAILEMQLPGMNGLELAHVIKYASTLAGVQLLLLTSIRRPCGRVCFQEAGFAACITKPMHHLLCTTVSQQ